ncbi:hypothetical protein PHYSODRAFT_320170 [Phytophthora sojae]|uniref:HTH CENPB-type domain-containing protein n=1 Tax=Phytophthora sojae (strain P6497) TaxID=1094619 RepID=G5AGW0_PHYSP|nr:hypothetical protein PHYSODRAFT_320170 [Phytophthora sojae]EGZ05153.1 hypothetical protein PHYSODRAFT_320170 [Phytophthora sojae]|eukprot:XP_009539311.1 hypothetical protein PHYSODRAFT_320170 [Phytophthora sojae]
MPSHLNSKFQPKSSRVSFTNAQRLRICEHQARNPHLSQNQLDDALSRADTALANWVCWRKNRNVTVTGDAIREKAARFARIPKLENRLTWSNGWLHRFNIRHRFGSRLFGKETKTRMAIALTCNADGTERLPPLFVGKSKKPRGFKKDMAMWMSRAIFSKWLKDVGTKFRLQHRKVLTILDNATVHGSYDADSLTNVEVVSSHPTRPLLDAGIIAAFKRRYRRRQIQHALDLLEADPTMDISKAAKLYKVDIYQCWGHTVLLDNYMCECDEPEKDDSIADELSSMLSSLRASNPMSVEELLNPIVDIIDKPTDGEFCGIDEDKNPPFEDESGAIVVVDDEPETTKEELGVEASKVDRQNPH